MAKMQKKYKSRIKSAPSYAGRTKNVGSYFSRVLKCNPATGLQFLQFLHGIAF